MLPDTFNKPEFPITPNDWPYTILYRVYYNSPLMTSHIFAASESNAIELFTAWLGEHYSIHAVKSHFSIWDLNDGRDSYHMLCTGTKHKNQPLYKYWSAVPCK